MPDVVRSDGSLDEFLNALVAQSAPPPKPTATQTVLDIRRALTGGQTPVPKPVLVPGYADGTSDVPDPNGVSIPLPSLGASSFLGPVAARAASSAGQGITAGINDIMAGQTARGIGHAVASGLGGILGVPAGALADTAAVPISVAKNVASGVLAALPENMASQLTRTTGKPVTTADTGEHKADHTIDDFIAANKHLTNNQILSIIGATPKQQTPAQQLIAKLTNAHQKTFDADMADAEKLTGDAKTAKQKAANDRLLQGLTAITNTQLGVLKYGAGDGT